MGLKYQLKYKNLDGDDFHVDMIQKDYTGDVIRAKGKVNLFSDKSSDILNVTRGMGLELQLEADQDMTFEDLYTEVETDLKVDLYRNGQVLFKGFIKPDDLYADFVHEKWVITLDCIDGLGILKDLQFVKETGLKFIGFMTEIEIIYHCLKRTSLNLPINSSIDIWHDGMDVEEDVLSETQLSTGRFYKDEGKDDIMDCDEVLKSVLEKYTAVIQQQDGEWFIYRPIDLHQQGSKEFFRYVDGTFDSEITRDLNKVIGSQIKGFENHHINENQKIEVNGSISKFRVEYKYGLGNRLISNPNFIPDSNGNVPGWDMSGINNYEINDQFDGGILWDEVVFDVRFHIKKDYYYTAQVNRSIAVEAGDVIKMDIDYESYGRILGPDLKIYLEPATGPFQYFMTPGLDEWNLGETDGDIEYRNRYNFHNSELIEHYTRDPQDPTGPDIRLTALMGSGRNTKTIKTEMPEAGTLHVQIYPPTVANSSDIFDIPDYPEQDSGILHSFDIRTDQDQELTEKGEFHTAELVPRNSSNRKKNITVYNGDNKSDIYEGVIKRIDGRNTYAWGEKGGHKRRPTDRPGYPNELVPGQSKSALELMVYETIRLSQKPQRVFTGDVYGYIDYLSAVKVDGINAAFFPMSYHYDTYENIISFSLNQVYSLNFGRGRIEYELILDRENAVQPAIEG